MISGCCPPLALPRRSLGGEIIGFDEKTGQFVQASAGFGATRIVEYPYYASAGVGGVGGAMGTALLVTAVAGVGLLLGLVLGRDMGYQSGVEHAMEYDCDPDLAFWRKS